MKKGDAVGHRLFRDPQRRAVGPARGSVAAAVAAAVATATAVTAAAAFTTTATATTVAATAAAAFTATAVTAAAAFTTAAAEAATTAAASTTAAVGAAEASRTLFTWASFVHDHSATGNRLTIQTVDGGLCFCIRAHFDETKALGATGVAVHHDLGGAHGPELRESILQILIAHGVGEIAHVKFVAHGEPLSKYQSNHVELQRIRTHSIDGAASRHRPNHYG
jgi:hypothetical protein